VFGRSGSKVLEIGFGMGDSLLQMAAADPETDFIGIEVHPPGVGTLINEAQAQGIENLRVYLADANDVLDECFAPQSIDRLQLYFPDPWHKKKHNKRRIVQPQFIQQVREKLRPGGVLHMATDWQHYAEQMLETLDEAQGFINTAGSGHYAPRPDYRPITKFEKRGERLGHGVWDLIYQKTD
jgi:tRNA (guanine-N7-)-methyltransferase